jgi:hypothetical protein
LVSSKKPENSAAMARQKADTGRLKIEQEFKIGSMKTLASAIESNIQPSKF